MNIHIITRAKLSLSRAHSINILKTAEHLACLQGVGVRVISFAAEDRMREALLRDKGIKFSLDLDVSTRRRSAIRYLVHASDYDILYFRDPWLIFAALYARLVKGRKIVFEAHGSHEWRFALPLWHFAVRASDGAVFITKKLAQYYRIKKGYAVVPTNAVVIEEYATRIDLARIGVPRDVATIMYVGSFLWYSIDTLVDMMQELKDERVHLVVVGPTANEEGDIQKRMQSAGLEKRCTIVRRVMPTEVPGYLCAADILVNPLVIAYPGSVSSKLYEYLAAGKPIITTLGGANDEVIADGENGIIVRELSGKSFAQAVLRVLRDKEFAARVGEAARASAAQYTWEARAKIIYLLCKEITKP